MMREHAPDGVDVFLDSVGGEILDPAAELAGWLREGRLISPEDVLEGGVRAFPDALLKLFAGENAAKLMPAVQ
jgi:NADPH-dependent curcumin reductase CurA